ncbi:MAG: hypothetical protein PWQ68_2277, partial [Thermoanaerobacteraceae bacterium]|nr:hypothetical protein [Thermoanaerobacteraceae bacterium]
IVTIDVSAAVEVVMGRPKQQQIIDILEKAEWIIAPSLYIFEASNVMWKYNSIQNHPAYDAIPGCKSEDYIGNFRFKIDSCRQDVGYPGGID